MTLRIGIVASGVTISVAPSPGRPIMRRRPNLVFRGRR